MLAAVDGAPAGVLAVADTVKDDSAAAIAALRRLGLDVVMLTGDNAPDRRGDRPPGRASAGCWPRCCPSTRPTRSAACRPRAARSAWSATASTTPPPWPQADVGLAIGTGTDVAIEASDITLISGVAGRRGHRHRAVPGHHAQHPAEPVLRVRLQRHRHPARRRGPLPASGHPADPDDRRRRHGLSSLSVVTNANRLRRYHPAPRCRRRASCRIEPQVETPGRCTAPAASRRPRRAGHRPGMRDDSGPGHRPPSTAARTRAPCSSAPRAARPPSTQPNTQGPARPARRHAARCDGGQYDTPDRPHARHDCHDGHARGRPALGLREGGRRGGARPPARGRAVEANPVAQTATVTYDPARTSVAELAGGCGTAATTAPGQSVPDHVCDPLARARPALRPRRSGARAEPRLAAMAGPDHAGARDRRHERAASMSPHEMMGHGGHGGMSMDGDGPRHAQPVPGRRGVLGPDRCCGRRSAARCSASTSPAPFGLRDDVFSLLLSLPVIFYSAWIFFDGAVPGAAGPHAGHDGAGRRRGRRRLALLARGHPDRRRRGVLRGRHAC